MDKWRGLSIIAIWISVAACGLGQTDGITVFLVALCAAGATFCVAPGSQ
ncbi:hypothetical protein ACFL2D_02940 [Patescibacteria group bacterium]